MKLNSSIVKRTGLVATLVAVAACSQQPELPVVDCSVAQTNNVDRLFAEVGDKLRQSSCHYSFPEYHEMLLSAAKGSPGPENEARFAGLLRESIEQGIISKRQGQELFSQYFDPEFYIVKIEPRNSCSSLRRKDQLYAAMREELAFKKEGMLEVLNDEQRFRQAQHHYSDLNMVFDAVEVACTEEL